MNTKDLIQRAINSVSTRLHSYETSKNPKLQKNAITLSYWLHDYMNMLKREETFNSKKLKRYKRGEIIKVHLGYNIGSEQGGLHYAIVLTKNDSKNAPALTIIPLSSVKEGKPLHPSNVFLGNTIFQQLTDKWTEQYTIAQQELEEDTKNLIHYKNMQILVKILMLYLKTIKILERRLRNYMILFNDFPN